MNAWSKRGVALTLGIVFSLLSCVASAANVTATSGPKAPVEFTWKAGVVVGVLVALAVLLLLNWVSAIAALVGSAVLVRLIGIISTTQLFEGFVSNGILSLTLMFIIVHPVAELPLVRNAFRRILRPSSEGAVFFPMLKLFGINAIVSIFIENVPQVALLTPIVVSLADEFHMPLAQLLMPMSHLVAISNGSVLASSSNLVVETFLEKFHTKLDFFELIKTSAPVTAVCLVYALVAARFLLPNKAKDAHPVRRDSTLGQSEFAKFTLVMCVLPKAHSLG